MAINKTVRNAIADGAITSDTIEDGAVTSGKLGAGNISLSKTLLGNAAPTISSLNTSQIDPDSGATVTITGTGFVSIPDVRFMNTSTGVRIQASTIGFTSSTTITAAFPSGQTPGTYKVLVENADGKGAISTSTITYSAAPSWSTAANLGSIEEGESVNIQLLAYDDDSTAVSSYSLVSGSLPSGVTLSGDSSVGALTGTAPAVDADTNYTFTIRATDDESQTSDREFTLTITNWTVANSLRFAIGSSDYLNRTPSSAGNRKTFTWSFWVKRSDLASSRTLFSVDTASGTTGFCASYFTSTGELLISVRESSGEKRLKTNQVFRDVSAWYHIVIAFDTTQSTGTDRIKLYVNNSQVTSFSEQNDITQNFDTSVNNTVTQDIGVYKNSGGSRNSNFDGYMAEVVLVDGQALTPSSFGETDTASGIWKPKSVSGLTFGTNGFYLPFTNSGSLGADSSGNSNDFTVNNLTAIDQTTDTPVNNHSTLNPLIKTAYGSQLSNGNLDCVQSDVRGRFHNLTTIGASSGKYYAEIKLTGGSNHVLGVATDASFTNASTLLTSGFNYLGQSGTLSYSYYVADGTVYVNGTNSSHGATLTTNDILGIYLDLDNHKLYFSKNGSLQSSTGIDIPTGYDYFFAVGDLGTADSGEVSCNFGNPAFSISSSNTDDNGYGNFEYSPNITGDGVAKSFFALNTKNLAEYG